jgi:tetratricopeptide (TPR) repeat protein
MAIVYRQQGDYPKALEYYQKALDIYIPSVGEQHVEVAKIFQGMAGTFEKQDNRSDALQFYRKAMEIYRQSHGDRYTPWFEAQIERLGD